MMTAIFGDDRKDAIAMTISDELDRQSRSGAYRIDVDAMASAIDRALDGDAPRVPARTEMRQAKRPDQLNATNDG